MASRVLRRVREEGRGRPTGPTKVVYIAGWGRSGSTLLDRLLGLNPGFVSVGEIKFLWRRGLLENRPCGCGEPLRSCNFWREVLTTFSPPLHPARIRDLAADADRTRTRHLPLMLTPGGLGRYGRDLAGYRDGLASLYEGVAQASGSEVVIDSSKFPSYLFVLQQIPQLDVRVIHLVRDPRAVAHSWATETVDPDLPEPGLMPRQHPAVTAAYWSSWNLAVARICHMASTPRLAVRYEDLATDPWATVSQIMDWLGIEGEPTGFLDIDKVGLQKTHTVSGNPARHRTGAVQIGVDDRWRRDMTPAHRRLVWRLTWPVRKRFGYLD